MQINFGIVPNTAGAPIPAGFTTAVNYVASLFDVMFTSPITLNITVRYQPLGVSPDTPVMQTVASLQGAYSGAAVIAALGTKDAAQNEAIAPSTASTQGLYFVMASAEAKNLGFSPVPGLTADATITVNSSFDFSYALNGDAEPTQYSFVSLLEHEMTHAMGRSALFSQPTTTSSGQAAQAVYLQPLDLFRYTAPGVLALSGTTASYFSIDGGVSPLAAFNNALPWVKPTQGDAADWAIGGQNDSFNAFTLPGVNGPMSATDFLVMNALGYAASGSVIGTGQGFAKAGDLDIFRTNAAGALSVLEFGNSGSLSLTQALSNADGTAFEVTDPNARVVGSGVDLWGSGERSIFVQTADHQLSAYEFNAAGTMGFWETIELRNGTPLQFDAGTSVVGLTSNLAGTGETDVILRGTAGAVSWLAFDGNGSAEAAPMNFLYSDGSAATVTADTRIAGSAHNVLGTGEQDLLLVSGTGQLLLWGLALGASNLTNMGIALPRVSLDAQVQGIGTNLLGLGGTDLQIRSGGGSVTWEISNQGSVLASA